MKNLGELGGDDVLAFEAVKAFLEANSGYAGWGAEFSGDHLKLVSASSSPISRTVFEFQVKGNHTNGLGNLHGGCSATLFDWCTTTAIVPISKPGFWLFKGVSRTLNVTYLRPVAKGESVIIESEVVNIGKRLCKIRLSIGLGGFLVDRAGTLRGTMRRKSNGAILAICEHGKVNIDPEVNLKV